MVSGNRIEIVMVSDVEREELWDLLSVGKVLEVNSSIPERGR